MPEAGRRIFHMSSMKDDSETCIEDIHSLLCWFPAPRTDGMQERLVCLMLQDSAWIQSDD